MLGGGVLWHVTAHSGEGVCTIYIHPNSKLSFLIERILILWLAFLKTESLQRVNNTVTRGKANF